MISNQLQRHTAVKRAANIGPTQSEVLTRLRSLAGFDSFKDCLMKAKTILMRQQVSA